MFAAICWVASGRGRGAVALPDGVGVVRSLCRHGIGAVACRLGVGFKERKYQRKKVLSYTFIFLYIIKIIWYSLMISS